MDNEKLIDFGFKKVAIEEKEPAVRTVFNDVANKYDIMNDIMSFGLHRIWKRIAVFLSNIKKTDKVLDLAGGTGDIAKLLASKLGPQGKLVLADINSAMLEIGRDNLINHNLSSNTDCVQLNAESLPFAENSFNLVTMGFGLRNVTDKQKALDSIYRVLDYGGRALVLEFSEPNKLLRPLYDFYSFNILPKIGKIITGKEEHYQYLVESIRMHPNQDKLKDMFKKAGFAKCEYYNLCGGIVALHSGYKI